MSTNETPITRTAAYLVSRERLDASRRKTASTVKCNPPNKKCGSRCIPPEWDCRITGEGSDQHLAAVKTDPISGIANIQRGTSRLVRGFSRGNFSDVEGGKRAIIRGAVKIVPGNIKQKQELKAKLENRTRAIGMGLAVLTGGVAVHSLFMRTNPFGYRNGLGADINNATRAGISAVLDAVPILGTERRRVRSAAQENINNTIQRIGLEQTQGPSRLTAGLGTDYPQSLERITNTVIAEQNIAANGKLTTALRNLNERVRRSSSNQITWNAQHRDAFWNQTVRTPELESGRANIFARPAAEDFIRRQYNISAGEGLSTTELKAALADRIRAEHDDFVALARQQGFRITRSGIRESVHPGDRRRFIRDLVTNSTRIAPLSRTTRNDVTNQLENILSGRFSSQADNIYRDTLQGFDRFYGEIGQVVRNVAGAAEEQAAPRRMNHYERTLAESADMMRSAFLSNQMRNTHAVAGPAHAELIRIAYYNTRVVGTANSGISVTPRLAQSAASELAGRDLGVSEAERLLNTEYGYPRLTVVRSRGRRRDNEDLPPRVAAYLATRQDFVSSSKGQKCGASHIPKSHKCHKGGGTIAPASENKVVTTSTSPKGRLSGRTVVLGVLGVAAGTAAIMVAADAAKYYANKQLESTGNYRQVLKEQLKKDGLKLKDKDQALANYYDEVTKDWKPGEVVYYKNPIERKGHFGIYLGKREGRHQFAAAGNNTTPGQKDPLTANGVISVTEYGPKSVYDGAPVIWAKAPATVQPPRRYSDTEIVRRATLMLGKPYKLEMLENNCESWASMIVSGVPHSTQVKRFSVVTQKIIALRDKVASQASGKAFTANEMATWLAFNHRRFVADSIKAGQYTLKDPKDVLSSSMNELEAMSAIKNYLMVLMAA